MQDPQPTAKRRLMRVLLRTFGWLIGIVLIILIVTGFVLTNLPKISADVSGSLRSNDLMGTVFSLSNQASWPVYDVKAGCEIAYSDEGNQCSGLIVISIPGWCDQSSERSDAGVCIL